MRLYLFVGSLFHLFNGNHDRQHGQDNRPTGQCRQPEAIDSSTGPQHPQGKAQREGHRGDRLQSGLVLRIGQFADAAGVPR